MIIEILAKLAIQYNQEKWSPYLWLKYLRLVLHYNKFGMVWNANSAKPSHKYWIRHGYCKNNNKWNGDRSIGWDEFHWATTIRRYCLFYANFLWMDLHFSLWNENVKKKNAIYILMVESNVLNNFLALIDTRTDAILRLSKEFFFHS